MNGSGDRVSFIWSVADLLRGPYKPAQYGRVILPLTVLRRLDCVLEPTKAAVLARHESLKGGQLANTEPVLKHVAGQAFHNTSRLDFPKLTDDPANIAADLQHYIAGFSERAREIIEHFGFEAEIEKLDKAANETAGDHLTPREVIRLMVDLLFEPDGEALTRPGIVRTLCDPACGAGGMLSVAEDYLRELNPQARLECYGQEYDPESYAICGSDLMMKGQNLENVKFGDSFTADGLAGMRFDYLLANPPFGVEWKPEERFIRGRGREPRLRRPLRRRPAAHQRRLLPLSAAHDQQDEARRLAPGHGLERLAAVHRRRRLGREQHPPLDHRERLARGDRGAARSALLQHRHQHVRLDRDQPQTARPPRQGPAHRRHGLQPEDARGASATSATSSARSTSTRSRASTANAPRASTAGSSRAKRSAIARSPSSGR